jgi:hypothetical protein
MENKFGFTSIYLTNKEIIPDGFLKFVGNLIRNSESFDWNLIPDNWELLIRVVPNDKKDELDLRGPKKNKHEKYIYYTCHLPVKIIFANSNKIKSFIDYFFHSLELILVNKYNLSINELYSIKSQTEEIFMI